MKRAAPSPVPGSAQASCSGITHRTMLKNMDEKVYYQKYQLGMARYYAAKAEALQQPFALSGPLQFPFPFRKGYDVRINPAEAQQLAKYDGVDNNFPLDGDAIVAILKQTKPNCPKAKAWIKAHEYSKEIQGEMEGKIRECENMRKQALRKLRVKTLRALKASNASKTEVQEVLTRLPPAHMCEISKEPGDNEVDEEVRGKRALNACTKLQGVVVRHSSQLAELCHPPWAFNDEDEEPNNFLETFRLE